MLSRVQCPVLIIQGNPERGGLLTNGDVVRALSQLTDGRHVMIAEVGHDMHQEDPVPVLQVLTEFLDLL